MIKLSMSRSRLCFSICVACALAACVVANADTPLQTSDLTELSLQELANVKVTTFAKRPQRAADVAAALFVITQDDIRRSGATSIPEALRLAPGLQVARIDGNKWAISSRGFSGRFSNKLLVLMDGRTLYTPSFGGVYWDVQDLLIDDIERIEVIRGPAGTTWGTNAVNGIINIITKRADQTDGLLVGSDVATDGSAAMHVRFGNADADNTQWRVYAKASDRASNEVANGRDAYDDSEQQRIGARIDHELAAGQTLRLSVEGYQGRSGHTFTGSFMEPSMDPVGASLDATETVDGAWAAAGWSQELGEESSVQFQMYVDHSDRSGPVFGEERDTLDVDFQHVYAPWQSHTVTWGLGVRYNRSHLETIEPIDVDEDGARLFLGSAYLQDEISLFDGSFSVTLGARIEDSNRDDAEVLPNLRARWALTEGATMWAAVGRGLRRPGRIEEDFQVSQIGDPMPPGSPMNPFPVPIVRGLFASNSFDSEELIAYEGGWRWQPHADVSVDLALFYNDYDQLRTLGLLPPYCMPSGELLATNPLCVVTAQHVMLPGTATNATSGHGKGTELSLGWTPLTQWRLTATYSHLQTSLRGVTQDPATLLFVLGQDPEHQYSLRSSISVGPRWDWDVFAKHRSEIASIPLDSSTQLDSRIAWRPTLDLEVALIGRNLLDHSTVEAASELFDLARVSIERDAFVQLRWSFR